MMDTKNKITKIIPASQPFQAVFYNVDGTMIKKPVICWAVMEAGEDQTMIKGMCDGEEGIAICDDITFYDHLFVGYMGPGEDILPIIQKAEELLQDIEDEEDILENESDFGVVFNNEFLAGDQEYLKQDNFIKNLPMALSQLSVLVREQIDGGYAPKEWEQWMDMMLKFSHLIEETKGDIGKRN